MFGRCARCFKAKSCAGVKFFETNAAHCSNEAVCQRDWLTRRNHAESTRGEQNSLMWQYVRRISLTQWILISMVLGIAAGCLFPEQSQSLRVVSNIFLRMIKCLLVPLVFGTLVVGIASHADDLKAVGRLALKSILYFEIVTTL